MNRLLVHQPSSVTSAAFLLGGIGMASLVLGFFRNTLLAVYFGAVDELDIYFASFRVPDIFFNFFFLGALSAGFIPIFSSYWSRGEKKQAWRLTSDILNTALFIFAFIALILILIAPFVMPFVVPGFSEEKLRFTVFLTRLMLLQPIILAVSNVFSGVLTGCALPE